MTERKIELVKPDADAKGFDRGERIIMVDGVRWGRTHVKSHGRRGTTTTFEQEHGEEIAEQYAGTERACYYAVKVHSERARRYERGVPRSTEELVLEKIKELIGSGKLRDPAIVKAEVEARRSDGEKRFLAAREAEARLFLQKATEALGDSLNDPDDVIIDRIVAAMRWAQEQ